MLFLAKFDIPPKKKKHENAANQKKKKKLTPRNQRRKIVLFQKLRVNSNPHYNTASPYSERTLTLALRAIFLIIFRKLNNCKIV